MCLIPDLFRIYSSGLKLVCLQRCGTHIRYYLGRTKPINFTVYLKLFNYISLLLNNFKEIVPISRKGIFKIPFIEQPYLLIHKIYNSIAVCTRYVISEC